MPSKRVTVALIARHTHEGVPHEAGERISVRRELLPTLERLGVIEPGAGQGRTGRRTEAAAEDEAPAGDGDGDTATDSAGDAAGPDEGSADESVDGTD